MALSVREGKISSVLLLRRLRSGSHKNAHYAAFREVGRVIRTIQLLRYLTDPQMRRRLRPRPTRSRRSSSTPCSPNA